MKSRNRSLLARTLPVILAAGGFGAAFRANASLSGARPDFNRDIQPILENYCFDCHADGANKGGVALDAFMTNPAMLTDHDLWLRVLKNLRAGLMPPQNKARPTEADKELIGQWVKRVAFDLDPQHPDPGRITLRRLNRIEYRNTIRDLLGVDFNTSEAFPPDDTGHGFDNIGDVLTLPPMLLEKYVVAAHQIVTEAAPQKSLMQITSVAVTGPLEKEHWVQTNHYTKNFPKDVPHSAKDRRAYARELLGGFALRAFRRPPDDRTLDRLVELAEAIAAQPGQTFEAGISEGVEAILCSPRFLFLAERAEPLAGGETYPLVDEYSLASRLSYFLWSTMPDEELMKLAAAGQLRKNFSSQVARMLKDPRSEALVNDFTGQWLRARDIETVPIEARSVVEREQSPEPAAVAERSRFQELSDRPEEALSPAERAELANLRSVLPEELRGRLRAELTSELREAMKLETEKTFDYVLHHDRCLLELIDADYTFLNSRLARHYGILTVQGDNMQYVQLPPGSPRGGVLTEGTVLAVTSNPTRTSPVKRGLFILDSILGTPPPPPPPNVPPLESASTGVSGRIPTLRETLAAHRENPLCSSCHNRMDPLGLALENFNALGCWRDEEYNEPIDASGKLMTGESFTNIIELKHLLVKNHSEEFYRTLTEKMLTYALGRGLDYYDVETTDQIVARIESTGGKPSALIEGIVESAPFQRTRVPGENRKQANPQLRADARTRP
ncbi:MAG TPA: DUF1592 domain-containing protein [Candidatus Acidoferrales bacterium]|nr:DUF1592 domain-containing protein [Candidatus Acidoferrales bacterium]